MRTTYLGLLLIALAVGSSSAQPTIVPKSIDTPAAGRGLDPVPDGWPVIIATKNGIFLEGKAIVSISNGAVDPAEKEGGAVGIKITRLTKFVEALIAAAKVPLAGFVVAMDEKLTYRMMIEILSSTKSAVNRFGVLGKNGTSLGVIPLVLPTKASLEDVKAQSVAPKNAPIKLVVSVTKDKLLLWSISGLEGSLKTPKLTLGRGDVAKLTAGLAEIAKRRFGTTKRPDDDRIIIFMADGAISIKDVVEILVAIRTTVDGKELFPDVLLSSGFE